MKEVFTYIFKDAKYKEKTLKYLGICFLSLVLMAYPEVQNSDNIFFSQSIQVVETNFWAQVLPIIGKILNLVLIGYYFTCIKAILIQNQNIILPFMNVKKSFIVGLRFLIATLFIIVSMLFFLFFFKLFFNKIIMNFLTIALILFFLFFINAFSVLFAKDSNLLTFFAWKKVILIISCNFCRYFKFWTYNLLITIIGAVISILFTYLFNMIFGNIYIAWLVTSIEAAFIATYIAFINMYLVAKSVDSDSVV